MTLMKSCGWKYIGFNKNSHEFKIQRFTLYGELGIATLFFSKNCDHGNHGYCGYHSNHGNHGSLENATLWLMQTLYFGLCGEI